MEIKAEQIKQVDFYYATDGSCPMCTMVKPKIEELDKYIEVNWIDVKDPENSKLIEKKGIRSIPQIHYGKIDFVGIPNIVKIIHPVINYHKEKED